MKQAGLFTMDDGYVFAALIKEVKYLDFPDKRSSIYNVDKLYLSCSEAFDRSDLLVPEVLL